MISPRLMFGITEIVFLTIGLWWLLPGSAKAPRVLGALLAAIGFGMFASQVPVVGDWLGKGLLAVTGTVTVVAGVATISCRSPVYCAIWFGMTLVGTAGLFLLAGAEFLAVATIVVYAGAILVTFLFVLMLSQPEGHTTYDRRSWEAPISAFIGAVLVGILTATIAASIKDVGHPQPVTTEYNVSRLGAELFTRYMIAVEAAGALLFAALVGAAVIVAQGRAAMKRRNPLARTGGSTNAS
jgi:NADH-quinone oxidoreductase subunit J